MDGAELKEFVEGLIDDTLDETLFYQLLNVARIKLEEKREWEFLKKEDSSKSLLASYTYLTTQALASDFGRPYKFYILDANNNPTELEGCLFEERRIRQNEPVWYIDYGSLVFGVCGTRSQDYTVLQIYLRTCPDIDEDTSPVFPSRFHPILGFMVAGYHTAGVDADDIYARMSPEHKRAALELENSMVMWDTNLKLRAMNNRAIIK